MSKEIQYNISADASNATRTLGELKQEFESLNQVLDSAEKGSQEFNNTLVQLGKLKGEIEGVEQTIDALNPQKTFENISRSLSGIAGGFQSVAAATQLFGVENEQVLKSIQQLNSLMAVTAGFQQFAEAIPALKALNAQFSLMKGGISNVIGSLGTLRGALIATGLGALVVTLGLVVANWEKISVAIGFATKNQKLYDEAQKQVTQDLTKFNTSVIDAEQSINLAKKGVISKKEALDKYNSTLGDSIGKAKTLDEAEKLIAKNAPLYIESLKLKTQAQVFFSKAAEESAKIISGEAGNLGYFEQLIASFGGVAAKAAFIAKNYKEAADNAKEFTEEGTRLLIKQQEIERQLKSQKPIEVKVNTKTETKEEINKKLDDVIPDSIEIKLKPAIKIDEIKFDAADQVKAFDPYFKSLVDKSIATTGIINEQTLAYEDAMLRANQTTEELLSARIMAYTEFAYIVGDILGELSQFFEEGSRAQKAIALAEITTNFAAGLVSGYRIAQQSAQATGPGAAFVMPLFYAQQVATLLAVVNKARGILKVGSNQNGQSFTQASTAQQVTLPPRFAQLQANVTQTVLSPIDRRLLNQPMKAIVVETDITKVQNRVKEIERGSSF